MSWSSACVWCLRVVCLCVSVRACECKWARVGVLRACLAARFCACASVVYFEITYTSYFRCLKPISDRKSKRKHTCWANLNTKSSISTVKNFSRAYNHRKSSSFGGPAENLFSCVLHEFCLQTCVPAIVLVIRILSNCVLLVLLSKWFLYVWVPLHCQVYSGNSHFRVSAEIVHSVQYFLPPLIFDICFTTFF